MTVVDSHAHLGSCRVFDLNVEEDALIQCMNENNVDASILQPFPGAPDPVDVHNRIADLAKKYPGRIYGLASLSPHMDKEKYFNEIGRCVEELGFVGVKMHTVGHAVLPLSVDASTIFEAASHYRVPVNVHTGPGIPFSSPSLCLPLIKKYPDVKVVLAHSGFSVFSGESFVIAKEYDNVYLETSWSTIDDIKLFVEQVGAGKVMMGSDGLANLSVELAKYEKLGLKDEELELVLGKTAVEVFQIDQ